MALILRLAAAAVTVAALALSAWAVWRWQAPLDRLALTNPFQFDGAHPPSWSDALTSVVPLVINSVGVAILLLAWACRLEDPTASKRPRITAGLTGPVAMTTWATIIVASCALLVVIVLASPALRWKTITGVSMMIEFVDVTGVLSLVEGWVVLVALLLISLAIAILLYADATPGGQANKVRSRPGGHRDE